MPVSITAKQVQSARRKKAEEARKVRMQKQTQIQQRVPTYTTPRTEDMVFGIEEM